MFEYPAHVYIMVAFCMFLVGMAKGGFGALGAIAVPLMALVLPIKDVVGMWLPVLMLADIFAVSFHWKKWDKRLVLTLIPASLIGVSLGTIFLANAPERTIRIILGVIVILFAIYKLFEARLSQLLVYSPKPWHGLPAGSMAGFTSSVAHTGEPPVSIFLLLQNLQPRTFAATSAIFFLALNYIKLPFYVAARIFNFTLLLQLLWLLPLVPLGVWAGKWLIIRVSKEIFDRIILVLLVFSALLLLFT